MVIIKVLKRKDASSVVVAVIVALIVLTLLASVTAELTGDISGVKSFQVASFDNNYVAPTVSAVLQLLALEVLGWTYIIASKVVTNLPISAPKRK